MQYMLMCVRRDCWNSFTRAQKDKICGTIEMGTESRQHWPLPRRANSTRHVSERLCA